MTDAFSHLSEPAKKALALPEAERIAFAQKSWWIGYERANSILGRLEDLMSHAIVNRMPNMILMGSPTNGKTHLIRRFHSKHKPFDDPNGQLIVPSLLIQMPKKPDEREFYISIIDAMGLPYRPNDHLSKLQYKAFQLLMVYKVKVLLIDEIHNLTCGSPNKQREILNLIKGMTNRFDMSIVGAGTRDAAQVLQLDTQFSSRFDIVHLPNWQMGPSWQSLLASFEKLIPLSEPSNLAADTFARFLLAESDKTIGGLWDMLTRCTMHAVRNSEPKITKATIKSIEWVRPSERIRHVQSQLA